MAFMAGGRRRRRNSKTGSVKSAASDIVEEAPRAPSIVPEEPVSAHESEVELVAPDPVQNLTTEAHNPPGLDDSYDPFSYDSELETLSSVSSHSSITSANGSMLDDALGLSANVNGQDDMSDEDEGADLSDDVHDGSRRNGSGVHAKVAGDDQDEEGSGDHVIRTSKDSQRSSLADGSSDSNASGSDKRTPGSQGSDADDSEDNSDKARKKQTVSNSQYLSRPGALGVPPTPSRRPSMRSLMQPREVDEDNMEGDEDDEDDDMNDSETNALAVSESAADTPGTDAHGLKTNGIGHSAGADMDVDAEERVGGADGDEAATDGAVDDEDEEDDSLVRSKDENALANEARRSEALAELTCIEIEFAKLRERLYCERLQQVQIEEDYLNSGQHSDCERLVEEITSSHTEHLERLEYRHSAWLQQRQNLHEAWVRTVNYTYLVKRQELRSRLLEAQRKRLWRLRDMRVQEDRRYAEKAAALRYGASAAMAAVSIYDEDVALITQQSGGSSIEQLRRARRAAQTAQKCLVRKRKQRLAVPGLDPDEMDMDYVAMQMPVYPREHNANGFRRIYVPSAVPESDAASTGRKRKQRQPRQPRKKRALDAAEKGRDIGGGNAGGNPEPSGSGTSAAGPSVSGASTAGPSGSSTSTVGGPSGSSASTAAAPATRQPADVVTQKQQPHKPSPSTSSQTNGHIQAPIKTHPPQPPKSIAATGAEHEHYSSSDDDMQVPPGNSGPLGLKV
ncbi:hypothetical protein LPJ53_002973 [Coemansia erecta]|uniref:Uncharacterized protein n=1 Tax=Coemansia erecta TaxID=147472 RepID=A0A9W7Y087_9FUNG|nr:hypothetical protein LPJ53_002973 [Coemansia erecta]